MFCSGGKVCWFSQSSLLPYVGTRNLYCYHMSELNVSAVTECHCCYQQDIHKRLLVVLVFFINFTTVSQLLITLHGSRCSLGKSQPISTVLYLKTFRNRPVANAANSFLNQKLVSYQILILLLQV